MDGQEEDNAPNKPEEEAPASEEPMGDAETGYGDKGHYGDEAAGGSGGDGEGPVPLRGVFLGNLTAVYKSEEVAEIFNKPIVPRDVPEGTYNPMPVDRVDLKRGYCFVFLKDAPNATERTQVVSFAL